MVDTTSPLDPSNPLDNPFDPSDDYYDDSGINPGADALTGGSSGAPSTDTRPGYGYEPPPGQGNAVRPPGVPISSSGTPNQGWITLADGTKMPMSLFLSLDPQTQAALTGVATGVTSSGSTVWWQPTPEVVPSMSYDDFLGHSGGGAGGGGGGGGGGKGGAGGAKLTFDKAALTEAASNMWFALLLQGPPDKEIKRIVESFMRDAQAFYQADGGQIDFETFLRNEIRRTDQHAVLYKWKPKGMLEEEYLRPYTSAASQFGLAPSDEIRQTRISAGTGAAPVEQAQRISRSRQVMNQGGWSGRMAQFLSALGPGMG